jgi:serine/threonine protein kinase
VKGEVLKKAPGCLIAALQFIHDKGVYHNDLKAANLLIHGRNILIVDFGSAKNVEGMRPPLFYTKGLYKLGRIFLRIAIVIAHVPLANYRSHFETHSPRAMDYLRWIAYLWALRCEDPESEDCCFAGALCELVFLLLGSRSSRGRRIPTVQLADIVVGSEDRHIEV